MVGVTGGATVTVTDPLNHSTTYSVDQRGWVTDITDALGNSTTFEYVFSGETFSKLVVSNPRGVVTEYTYDQNGRVIQTDERVGPAADWPDLVAPGVTSRTQRHSYDPVTGDRVDWAAQSGPDVFHGTTVSLAYSGESSNPYRLTGAALQRYVQAGAGNPSPAGGVTQYTYDAGPGGPGWLTRVVDPNSAVTDISYFANGTVRSVTRRDIDYPLTGMDPQQLPWGDPDRALLGAPGIPGRDVVQEFTYHPDGQVREVTEWHRAGQAATSSTSFEYDAAGRLTRVVFPDGGRRYILYDPSGLPVLTVDEGGVTEVSVYDGARRQTARQQMKGQYTHHDWSYTYDAAGRNVAVTDPLNNSTVLFYDDGNRLSRAVDPNGIVTAYTYDRGGNVTAVAAGAAAAVDQGTAPTVHRSYYLSGLTRQIREIVPTGVVQTGVTALPSDTGDPAGTTYISQSFQYNRLGQVTETQDGNGRRTSYGYDDLDRLSQVVQYLGAEQLLTQYTYDPNGNRTSVTDAGGQTSRYFFDRLNRLWRRVNPLQAVDLEMRYDDQGNVRQKVEPRTADDTGTDYVSTINYTYDARQRLTGVDYPRDVAAGGAPDVVYAYDAGGRRVHMWDGYGHMFYKYDILGRLQVESGRNVYPVFYGYDEVSRLDYVGTHLDIMMPDPEDPSKQHAGTRYYYDNGGRLTKVKDPLGFRTEYTYDSITGNLSSVAMPLQADPLASARLIRENIYASTSGGYQSGRLSEIQYRTQSGSAVWSGSYKYDLAGMVTAVASDAAHAYTYDDTTRLVKDQISNQPPTEFTYDNGGNRTQWTYAAGGQTRRVEQVYQGNRLIQVLEYEGTSSPSPKATSSFAYEGNGNIRLETRQQASNSCAAAQNIRTGYDDANRLTSYREVALDAGGNEIPGAPRASVSTTYDGDGHRLSVKTQNQILDANCNLTQTETWFTAYDYANGKVLNERTSGNVPVWYIRDAGGELLYTFHWDNATRELVPRPYVRDHLGSVRMLLNANGSPANTYTYGAFGDLTETVTLRNSYAFTGYAVGDDPNARISGLYYAVARYYNPRLARFMTQDTYKGDPWQPWTQNVYTYVGNNPVNYIDPTGHCVPGFDWLCSAFQWVAKKYYEFTERQHQQNLASCQWLSENDPSYGQPAYAIGCKWLLDQASEDDISAMTSEGIMWGLSSANIVGRVASHIYSASNFRTNLAKATGTNPAGYDAHHVFPQQYSWFFEGKVDIHDPKYGKWWEASEHRQKAFEYNEAWAKFIAEYPDATQALVLQYGRDLMQTYGLSVGF